MTDHNLVIGIIRDEREAYQQASPQAQLPLTVVMKSISEIINIDATLTVEAGAVEGLLNSLERLAVRDKRRRHYE